MRDDYSKPPNLLNFQLSTKDLGLVQAEKTIVEFPVRRNADSIAIETERLTGRRNKSNPPDSVREHEFGRGSTMTSGRLFMDPSKRHDPRRQGFDYLVSEVRKTPSTARVFA